MDIVAVSSQAVAQRAITAPGLVFLSGIVSSFGPCVAPRFVAVSACASEAVRPRTAVASFVAGLVAAYASFGFVVSMFVNVRTVSSFVYAGVSMTLAVGGLMTIAHADHGKSDAAVGRSPRSLGGVFLLGASFAFVISPCCTPLVAMILTYTSLVGDRLYGAALLAVFAMGHAAPLVAYGVAGTRLGAAFRRVALGQAASTVSGALMLALAGYYGVLA